MKRWISGFLALLCAVLRSAEGSIMKGSVSSVVRVICYALMITILAAMLGGAKSGTP